ncbi:MAG TPA: sugar phosphate nucleotidyltransferase [Longimicrobiaceae bacterium]|nr:sugar phosphate nucleotidyltransferase [Longimicrobiaceae bacterium]
MWGIVPAAGAGSRIQPLAFSKELLPVGSRLEEGVERPRAVSEYLVERMIYAGADKICFVISPGKTDIMSYYGGGIGSAYACYVVQPKPSGLCDSIFRALPLIAPEETVVVGLPDTIWFPADGLGRLPDDTLSFLLFPVERPEFFDSVVTTPDGRVTEIQVKQPGAASRWVWGAFRLPGAVLRELNALWLARGRRDEYIGTLVNAWLALGGEARGVAAGEAYVDVGTVHGYREAIQILGARPQPSLLAMQTRDVEPGSVSPAIGRWTSSDGGRVALAGTERARGEE